MNEVLDLNHKIKFVPLENIRPYSRNARTHSEEQIEAIIRSITEFGWTNPILIDEKGEIIAGHGRYYAASNMGLKKIPAIELAHLTEAQKRAYILADNQLALQAGWDEELLKFEARELDDLKFDLSLIGFDDQYLNKLLGTAEILDQLPNLSDADESEFMIMSFSILKSDEEIIKKALSIAKVQSEGESQNQNGNGRGLAHICQYFMKRNES